MASAPVDRRTEPTTALAGVTSLAFASNFDLAALVVVVPVIRGDLGLQVHEAAALPKTFTLAVALLAPMAAVCGRRFGSGITAVAGGAMLVLAALGLAVADSVGTVIAAAAALGVGTAMARPQLLAFLRQITSPEQLAPAVGAWQAAALGASVLGGVAVALLAEEPGWRAIPVVVALTAAAGIAAAVCSGAVRLRPQPPPSASRGRLVAHPVAVAGAAVVALAAIASLARAVPHAVAFVVMAGGVGLAVAGWRLAHHPGRVSTALSSVLVGAVTAGLAQGTLYLCSFWALNDQGWSLAAWGSVVATSGVAAVAATVLTGRRLIAAAGPWPVLVAGAVGATSCTALAAVGIGTANPAVAAVAIIALGGASGTALAGVAVSVMSGARSTEAPAAASLLTSSLAVGGVVGLGIMAATAAAVTVGAWPGTVAAEEIADDLVLGLGEGHMAVEASSAFARGTASALLVGSALALVTLIACSATRDVGSKLH